MGSLSRNHQTNRRHPRIHLALRAEQRPLRPLDVVGRSMPPQHNAVEHGHRRTSTQSLPRKHWRRGVSSHDCSDALMPSRGHSRWSRRHGEHRVQRCGKAREHGGRRTSQWHPGRSFAPCFSKHGSTNRGFRRFGNLQNSPRWTGRGMSAMDETAPRGGGAYQDAELGVRTFAILEFTQPFGGLFLF